MNRDFEPVWVSLRPVPIVTIDFGNGTTIRRTLHGNVATYACDFQGKVLDVLPGIYEPKTYARRLEQLKLLHQQVMQSGRPNYDYLADYFQRQVNQLSSSGLPLELTERPSVTITGAEGPLEVVMRPAKRIQARRVSASIENTSVRDSGNKNPETWQALAEDTRLNESVRKLAIMKHLVAKEPQRPDQISKWLYREVLHADLDDPYLGLGKLLFDHYPFAEEDASNGSE